MPAGLCFLSAVLALAIAVLLLPLQWLLVLMLPMQLSC